MTSPKVNAVSWLHFGLVALGQVAATAAFVYGLHVRLMILEQRYYEFTAKSEADRSSLHSELRTLDQTKFKLDEVATTLKEVSADLKAHMKGDKS